MFLTSDTIRALCKLEPPLISPTTPGRLAEIEGAGYDLTIDRLFGHGGVVFIGKDHRDTGEPREIEPFNLVEWADHGVWPREHDCIGPEANVGRTWWLTSGFYLAQTAETVTLPPQVLGILRPRRTLFTSGIHVTCTDIAPGFSGKLTVAFNVTGPQVFLEHGAKILTLRFAWFEQQGKNDVYQHRVWRDDKVSTDGIEVGS